MTSQQSGRARNLAAMFTTAAFRSLAAPQIWEARKRFRALDFVGVPGDTVGHALQRAFEHFSSERRSEYVYKNDLVSKIVFGRHRPTTAAAALEFSIGASVADLLVLNGSITAYEIKTDLDTLTRLNQQVQDYRLLADRVFVVTSAARSISVGASIPAHVGLIEVTRSGRLRTLVDSVRNTELVTHDAMFDALRMDERRLVLVDAELDPSGLGLRELRDQFRAIPMENAREATTRVLKERFSSPRNLVQSSDFPKSLRALAYGTPLSGVAQERLLERLRAPIQSVASSL